MITVIVDPKEKERIAQFVIQQGGSASTFGDFNAIGVERDGKLVGGIVYDNYAEKSRISMCVAGIGKRWITRELLKKAFWYPFIQLKVNVIIDIVSSNNHESIELTKRVGFTQNTVIKGGAPDGDLIVFTMYKDQCKWLGV